MAAFYQTAEFNKELSVQLLDNAITNLLPFPQTPYIQGYLEFALKILEKWDVNIEEYFRNKPAANNKG